MLKPRRESVDAVQHRFRQSGVVNEQEVSSNDPNGRGQRTWDGLLRRSTRRRQQPWIFNRVFIGEAHAHANHISRSLNAANEVFNGQRLHPWNACKVTPLIYNWLHGSVQKDAIAGLTRNLLQRQRDQIPEPAFRQCVLIREEAIIRAQSQLMASLHSSGQECRAQASRKRGSD